MKSRYSSWRDRVVCSLATMDVQLRFDKLNQRQGSSRTSFVSSIPNGCNASIGNAMVKVRASTSLSSCEQQQACVQLAQLRLSRKESSTFSTIVA